MARIKSRSARGGIPLVADRDGLQSVAARLSEQPIVAFDTEFLWERTFYPKLGLIQVADEEQAWLIDPVALAKDAMQPLLEVLSSKDVLKVAHAIDQDQMCLHCTYGIVAEPVLDTSIAGALTGLGDQISLAKMLSKVVHVKLTKGYGRTNWLKRPLSKQMKVYAAEDVRHLAKAGRILVERLRTKGREDWAIELSSLQGKQAKAHFEPDALTARIAGGRRMDEPTYGALRELVAWREQEASRRNLPRRWLADDNLLIRLATTRPSSEKQLADFRGLNAPGKSRSRGRLLKAISRGVKSPPAGYEKPSGRRGPTPKESAALVVLRCFMNALAADNALPVRLLADRHQMVNLLRGEFTSVADLRTAEILDARAVDLVGQDLVEILNGRRGLRLVNGRATHDKGVTASP